MKKLTKICIASALAVLLVPFGVGLITAHADDIGQDVYADTRYPATGFDYIDKMVETFEGLASGFVPDVVNDVKGGFSKFGSKVADTITGNVVESANRNWGSSGTYTIQSAFVIMGKRKLTYANGEYEVQTIYLYKDDNVSAFTPQQFGTFSVAPNTILLVRDTTWNGVIPVSFPLGDGNNISIRTYNAVDGSACDICFNSPDNDTIVYDTPSGRETVGYRHGSNWSPRYISFLNNTVNSIVNNNLVAEYVNSQGNYNTYLPDYYCDNFEALLGTGYWYEGSQGHMTSVQDFYITSAFFNSDDEFGSSHINDYFTTDPNNIDPSKPPAYILPDNNPLSSGQIINNNTINNYADYGITEIDGELSLNPDVLAGALGGLIDPDFAGALGGVFEAQPQIGFGFDTPLDLNLPELFDNFIDSLVVSPSVTRPLVPTVTTFSDWDYLPSYTTQTFPVDLQDAAHVLSDNITGFTDSMGITSILLILALIGLMTYCIF